jgi:hypothetical protein
MAGQKFEKRMSMGLGEAILRLIEVESLRRSGLSRVPEEARAERDLIVEALNTHRLDLGFDCDADAPASVQIFAESAKTACCRLIPQDMSRRNPNISSSRRKL